LICTGLWLAGIWSKHMASHCCWDWTFPILLNDQFLQSKLCKKVRKLHSIHFSSGDAIKIGSVICWMNLILHFFSGTSRSGHTEDNPYPHSLFLQMLSYTFQLVILNRIDGDLDTNSLHTLCGQRNTIIIS
jgi:hypothetical protein